MTTQVSVSVQYTRNLGNYESVKLQHGIVSDEIKDSESIDEFHARLKAKVEKWLTDHINEVDADAARG